MSQRVMKRNRFQMLGILLRREIQRSLRFRSRNPGLASTPDGLLFRLPTEATVECNNLEGDGEPRSLRLPEREPVPRA
jgi:hypothetical protein